MRIAGLALALGLSLAGGKAQAAGAGVVVFQHLGNQDETFLHYSHVGRGQYIFDISISDPVEVHLEFLYESGYNDHVTFPGSDERYYYGGSDHDVLYGYDGIDDRVRLQALVPKGRTFIVELSPRVERQTFHRRPRFSLSFAPLTQGQQFNYSVTLTNVANPIPEPSTWALMIGGFALAGGALRRRRLHV